jgi:hypothetical protein
MINVRRLRRVILPLVVFLGVWAFHFVWLGLFPDVDPAQSRWATIMEPPQASWSQQYVETQSHWLGYSYALCLGFVAFALRRYREQRQCSARNLAIGGVTLSGFLAVVGCYLIGCCGSPMLIVYLNLFGAAFLPLAKPLMAAVTTVTIGGAWWWMNHRSRSAAVGWEQMADT